MATPAREEGGCLLDTSSAKQDEVDSRRVRRSAATELPEDLAFCGKGERVVSRRYILLRWGGSCG